MYTFSKYIVIVLFSINSYCSYSQTIQDTLDFSVKLQEIYQYESIYKLLGEYRKIHTNNLAVEWLYAQSAFYTGHHNEMIIIYEAAIIAYPDNFNLQLDYALKLTDIGNLNTAKFLLQTYVCYDQHNPNAYMYLAKIEYWQNNYNKALEYIQKASALSHNNPEIFELNSKILLSASPWIAARGGFFEDNQPLQVKHIQIQTGGYLHSLVTPTLHIESNYFDSTQQSLNTKFLQLQNSSHISLTRTKLHVGIGAFFYPNNSGHIIWKADIEQFVFKTVKFQSKIEHKPYVLLFKNLDSTVLYNDVWIGITREKKNSLNAQIAYVSNRFSDGNNIHTMYGWFVTPLYVHTKFSLLSGYGYSTTNSNNDVFTHKIPENELLKEVFLGNDIQGHFPQYVTPMQQKIHSLIAVVTYNPNKKIQLSISASYGFDAKINTPYVYAYIDENFELVVKREYYTELFKPFEMKANINYMILPNLSCNIEFKRSYPNYYYQTNFFEIGIKKIVNFEK